MRNKIKKNRWISWILTLAMLCSLLQTSAVPAFAADAVGAGVDIPSDDAGYTAIYDVSSGSAASLVDGGTYKITGHATNYQITVPDSANVTLVLDNVTITHTKSPLVLGRNSTATLVLLDRTGNSLICTATDARSNQTAGVLVPKTAKLIVDSLRGSAGTGTLNVTGGYGGAGIGGSAASGYGGTRNNNGVDAYIWNNSGLRAKGGQGGRNGIDAAAAGTITINAGTVNATGGKGGAGIGGGMGATGENGAMGAPCGEYNYLGQNWHSHTGGSGGGAGGNGGRGGRGGTVTINGGTVVAKATQYTVTKVGDMTAAGIGGGSGGLGGSGAAGHTGHYSANERSGGNGGYGQAGYVNYSGDGGTLTINGGKLLAVGKHGSGASQNPVVVDGRYPAYNTGFNLYANSSKGSGPCDGGRAGEGGKAIQPTVTVVQTQIKIANSNNNVRFLDSNNRDVSVGSQPTDQFSTSLYQVALTVRNKADNTLVSNANVAVAVNKDDTARKYSYKTVSDDKGIATLWLPKGEYTLTYFDVSRNDVGIIQQGDGVTFNVGENNNNAAEVKIGLDMTASASIPNSSKVYINDTTTVDGAPSSIKIDTTKTHDSQLGDITWFREPVNGNTQDYALYQTVSLPGFDTGFTNVTNLNDRGTLTVAAGTKQAELKVLENGRYWLKIPMTVTDPNDTTKSMTVNLIRLVEVKNIYRSFPIQVREKELDRDNQVKHLGTYGPLTNANGIESTANYGFPWDLGGYNASNIAQGTLLRDVAYDEVMLYPPTPKKARWYKAFLGNDEFTRKNDQSGYEGIKLTLNDGFLLDQAGYADIDAASNKKDLSKYTVTYSPDGIPVAEFPVRGIVENQNAPATTLWEVQATYPEGITEADISSIHQPGYRIEKVLVNGQDKTANFDKTTGSIHIKDLQGTRDNNYNDAVEKVEFVYVSNMTDVKISAQYNGGELQHHISRLEIGVETQIPAPSIPGYTAAVSSTMYKPTGANDETVEFIYTKDAGNITVIAKAADATELYRRDGGTVAKDKNITLNGTAAPPEIQYYTAPTAPTSVTVNGQTVAVDTLDTYTYDGVGDIEIVYTYTRKTQDITINKIDIDTKQVIETKMLNSKAVGETYTFQTADQAAPTGYMASPGNPVTYFVKDEANQTVSFYYKKTAIDDLVQIMINLTCDGTTFQTYPVTGRKGVALTVLAPSLQGYTLATSEPAYRSITPQGNAQDDVLTFAYTIDNPKTVTVKLKNNAKPSADFPAPTGYQSRYTLKQGDSLTIQAPLKDGYTLVSAAVNNATVDPLSQFVTVTYGGLQANDNTITFSYLPVSQANFVTHTVRFVVTTGTGEHILYEHAKQIAKGTGTQVVYQENDVQYTVPGYAYQDITYAVNGNTSAQAPDVTDAVDATITYRFIENAARIVIKQKCVGSSDSTTPENPAHDKTTTLTGYRQGQKDVWVVAPILDGHALKDGQDMRYKFDELVTGDNEHTFEYEMKGKVSFTLRELTGENDIDGKPGRIIAVLNAKSDKTYDAKATDGSSPLDLTQLGYQYTPNANASPAFQKNGSGKVDDLTTEVAYTVYYTKQTRPVEYVPVDKTKLTEANTTLDAAIKDKTVDKYTITGLTLQAMEPARVGESYMAVAQSFSGWALKDDFRKVYTVEAGTDALKVYFLYEQKTTGKVTVEYYAGTDTNNLGTLLHTYTFDAAAGETVKLTAPETILDEKYKLRAGQTSPVELTVSGTAPVTQKFFYEPNFKTVTENIVVDNNPSSLHRTHEVTSGKDLTLYPPDKQGYTLVGITGMPVGQGGTQDTLPNGYTGSITLACNDLTQDTTAITYYYKTTTADEYQTSLTISYKYNGYEMAPDDMVLANTGMDNTIKLPVFDGYRADTYVFTDGSTTSTPTGVGDGKTTVTIQPTAKTATLTIHYTRTDGTVVLPGKDNEVGPAPKDQDNVIVKPDPTKPPTIDGDGNVTIKPNDKDASVIRPIDPTNPDQGKEEIKVPGGTVIKPDGKIELPNGGEIKPGDKLPEKTPDGYIAVVYKANGGVGDDQIYIYQNNETIHTITNPFTNGGKAFTGWSTAENGIGGKNFGANAEVTGITGNVTLYAQWGKATYAHSTTITYLPNDGSGETNKIEDTVGANDSTEFSVALRPANTFIVTGWTFGGWNTEANGSGKLKLTNATVTAKENEPQTWYAQWYKQDGASITVPGKDGNPNNEATNVTGAGNGISRDPATGVITIPDGGTITVTKPDGKQETILLPNGGTLNPDGSYTINQPDGGKIEVDKDGNETSKDNNGDEKTDATRVTMTYQINNGEGDVVTVRANAGETVKIAENPFTWKGYQFLNWMGTDKKEYNAGAEYEAKEFEFFAQWAKKNTDGSVELPGKDGILAAPNDKDNVIVTPDPNGTLTGPNKPDGNVKVETGEATVTRPDPTDPNFPNGSKEDIKVPNGTIVKPDGTIKLPDGTIIKPETKLPDGVISDIYAIVTYEPNGGSGNVIRQMVKQNEASKALSGDVFTAPSGMIFEQWKNVTEDQTIAAGGEFTPTEDLTLKAQWKEKAQTPTSYSARIVFDSNTNDGTHTQTITGTNSKLITGQLAAYTDHFTAPVDWKFMGWSTIKAASRHATVYADSATVTLKEGTTLKLYAILYKVEDTGIVTLPGADGQPEGTDNVTVTPPAGTDITLGNGYVEAPKGSKITQPAGKIEVMEGTVIVYPDGSIYVPDGSQVKLPNGTTVDGEANIDKDGNVDKDKDKPIQKPDGTIVLPGEDKNTGTPDDIIVKPAGPNKPAGRIDEDGNVTITDPDGADVTFQGKDPENVKLPIGTVITPDGTVTLTYTLKYVDDKGKELETAELVQIKVGETERVKALSINGYNLKGEAVRNITGALRTALNDYIITFTYEKQKSDGGSGGSGGAGGGGGSVIVIGGGGGGSSLNPQKPTIITDGNLKYTLSKDGTSASLTPNDGYEINSIIVNGEQKGGAEAITGLKTGDIVKISAICYLDVIEEAQSYKLVARSKQIKRKNGMHPVKVKVTWYDENGKELKLDGYEIERSRKRYSGYQLRFKTDREVYYNTYIENGAKYYYRVRGYILFNGQKYYTRWSKKAWRTVKM